MSKNFLITGAARGIGRGLSRLLLEKGHRVLLVDNDKDELEHMRSQVLPKLFANSSSLSSSSLTSRSRPWELVEADLRQPSSIQPIVDAASTFFNGHLDVLINNAAYTGGVGAASSFADLSLESWNDSLATNLTAPMLLSQACLPMLLHRHSNDSSKEGKEGKGNVGGGGVAGSIIMMSSTRAHQSEPNSEGYAATKAGLLGLTHAMASSLSTADSPDNTGISVNAILPGWINVAHECKQGDEDGASWDKELTEQDHAWHFTGRVGRVEDVLRAVEYLVDAKDFVTGTQVVVDGGVSRKMVYPE